MSIWKGKKKDKVSAYCKCIYPVPMLKYPEFCANCYKLLKGKKK